MTTLIWMKQTLSSRLMVARAALSHPEHSVTYWARLLHGWETNVVSSPQERFRWMLLVLLVPGLLADMDEIICECAHIDVLTFSDQHLDTEGGGDDDEQQRRRDDYGVSLSRTFIDRLRLPSSSSTLTTPTLPVSLHASAPVRPASPDLHCSVCQHRIAIEAMVQPATLIETCRGTRNTWCARILEEIARIKTGTTRVRSMRWKVTPSAPSTTPTITPRFAEPMRRRRRGPQSAQGEVVRLLPIQEAAHVREYEPAWYEAIDEALGRRDPTTISHLLGMQVDEVKLLNALDAMFDIIAEVPDAEQRKRRYLYVAGGGAHDAAFDIQGGLSLLVVRNARLIMDWAPSSSSSLPSSGDDDVMEVDPWRPASILAYTFQEPATIESSEDVFALNEWRDQRKSCLDIGPRLWAVLLIPASESWLHLHLEAPPDGTAPQFLFRGAKLAWRAPEHLARVDDELRRSPIWIEQPVASIYRKARIDMHDFVKQIYPERDRYSRRDIEMPLAPVPEEHASFMADMIPRMPAERDLMAIAVQVFLVGAGRRVQFVLHDVVGTLYSRPDTLVLVFDLFHTYLLTRAPPRAGAPHRSLAESVGRDWILVIFALSDARRAALLDAATSDAHHQHEGDIMARVLSASRDAAAPALFIREDDHKVFLDRGAAS